MPGDDGLHDSAPYSRVARIGSRGVPPCQSSTLPESDNIPCAHDRSNAIAIERRRCMVQSLRAVAPV